MTGSCAQYVLYSCFRDLDQASMEAVASLLAGLPLQPEESDRGDLMEAKSQLFLKYSTLCFCILDENIFRRQLDHITSD